MRETLLDWLPPDLSGQRVLDAGCGTGALALEVARRGGQVVAIDLSPKLISLARERATEKVAPGVVEFRVGDMLDPALGKFDYVVAMDSLIHYSTTDVVATLATLAARTRCGMLFTFAPRTRLLTLMHGFGRLFPSSHRSPAIVPVVESALQRQLGAHDQLRNWAVGRTQRIDSGFYISQALEVLHS
jgi:magnesium-protoporphyrin O-methyltransferase